MISVTILVKDGECTLHEVLSSLVCFDEVVIYDTGSQDNTLEIAKKFPNVTIYEKNFKGFGTCHNDAATLAKHDWILSVDADEILSPELALEILNLKLNPQAIYSIPFLNFYKNKQIKCCGWYPEKHIRLYNKKMTSFSEALVHEGIIKFPDSIVITLKHPIFHYSYQSISNFLTKMERYSSLFAKQYQHKRKSSPHIALMHGMAAFFKSFILKNGWLGGYEGFLISAYNGHTAFYKYLKLYELNKQP